MADALSTDYDSKLQAYVAYGDRFDIFQRRGPSKDDQWNLEVGRGIDYCANHLMIVLISIIFFQNSAKRGIVQWGLIVLVFLSGLIVDILIGNPIDFEDGTGLFDMGETLRQAMGCPFATVAELSNYWRIFMVAILSLFLVYGILF